MNHCPLEIEVGVAAPNGNQNLSDWKPQWICQPVCSQVMITLHVLHRYAKLPPNEQEN